MKKRNRKTILPIGSISHGTLKTDDLVKAFIDALGTIQLSVKERTAVRHASALFEKKFEPDEEELEWTYEELRDIIDEHLPPYCYFGTTEGDGSDFGVWPDWRRLDEEMMADELANGEDLPSTVREGPSEFLQVNDHGNATYYQRRGGKWVEVWSVV